MQPQDQLELLLRVNAVLHSCKDLSEIMADLIAQVITTLKAQRGFVVVREGEQWRPLASHHMDLSANPAWRFSQTVVEKVATSGQPLLTSNAMQDHNLARVSSVATQNLRSIICAPLRWGGRVQGVVYADHNVARGLFREDDLQVLSAIADQASRTLEMADLHQRLQEIHQRHSSPAQTVDFLIQSLDHDPPAPAPPLLRPAQGLVIQLFGAFEVYRDGDRVEQWSTRKNRDLLAYLACHLGQVVREDRLVDLFWSQGGRSGFHSLHNSVTQLRKVLGKDSVQREYDGYTLSSLTWVDADQFSRAFREGRRAAPEEAVPLLSRAEALVGGTFLESFGEDWVEAPRQRLADELFQCRALLAEHFSRHGRHTLAVELWKRVLQCDDCNEEGYRGLLTALRALGRQAEALRVYQNCQLAYRRELDLDPPPEFSELAHF